MKTAVLTSPGVFEIREADAPEIREADDVLVRIALVGICGSDLHYFSSSRVGDVELRYPVRLGHECTGIVEAVGRNVTAVKRGDRVSIEPAVSCGACDQCLAGRHNTCRKMTFFGSPGQFDGALAEFLVLPERNCHLLPDSLSLAQGVLAEPLSIALWAVELGGAIEGKSVAVLGAGPIGLGVGLRVRNMGAKSVYMTEIVKARLKAAAATAADWTGNPERTDIAAEITIREPLGMDTVFECCGKQSALDEAVRILKPGGTLVLVGIPVDEKILFDISKMRRKEIRVQNVRRQNHTVDKALNLIAAGTLAVDFMATHTFPLERVQEAFETVYNYRDGVIKAMIRVNS